MVAILTLGRCFKIEHRADLHSRKSYLSLNIYMSMNSHGCISSQIAMAIIWLHPFSMLTDPSHKSQNASDKYPIMNHFVTEMCTHVHISVTKWCIVGYGTGALWDLCNRSIGHPRILAIWVDVYPVCWPLSPILTFHTCISYDGLVIPYLWQPHYQSVIQHFVPTLFFLGYSLGKNMKAIVLYYYKLCSVSAAYI